jgi:hypothetical protein
MFVNACLLSICLSADLKDAASYQQDSKDIPEALIVAMHSTPPTEPELQALLRSMTLEAFTSIPPPANNCWMIDEKSFIAMDCKHGGFIPINELKYKLRAIPEDAITVTFNSLKGYLDHYSDFFECSRPASYTSFAPVTYASINLVTCKPHSGYSCITFYWQPPTKTNQRWVLTKIQLM